MVYCQKEVHFTLSSWLRAFRKLLKREIVVWLLWDVWRWLKLVELTRTLKLTLDGKMATIATTKHFSSTSYCSWHGGMEWSSLLCSQWLRVEMKRSYFIEEQWNKISSRTLKNNEEILLHCYHHHHQHYDCFRI